MFYRLVFTLYSVFSVFDCSNASTHTDCSDFAAYREVSRGVYGNQSVITYKCQFDSSFTKQIIYSNKRYDFNTGMTLTFSYYDGVKQGISETYILGKLSNKKYFKGGLEHGTDSAFFENGTVFRAGSWINGQPSSVLNEFYVNGFFKRQTFFDSIGSVVRVEHFDSTGKRVPTELD